MSKAGCGDTDMTRTSAIKDKHDTHLPKRFNVSIGGFFSGEFSVSFKNGALIVISGVPCGIPSDPITPSPEAWQTFWGKLDLLGAWKWRKKYEVSGICDGTQWEIDIEYGGKRLKCYGSNSYPNEGGRPSDEPTKPFDEFKKAVVELCGIEITQDPEEDDDNDSDQDVATDKGEIDPVEWQYYVCPRCKCRKAVEIIYGMPSYDTFKLGEEGKLVIGGCCKKIDNPDRSCPDCKHEWKSKNG